MPRVLNKRGSADGVYIGRPSKFGNPFVIDRDGTRTQVIAKFEQHLRASPQLLEAARRELKGRDMKFAYVDYETTNELGMRWYLTPDGALPSITTVLSSTESAEKKNSLENWRQSLGVQEADAKSKKATEHGTMVHLLAERHFRGQEVLAPVDGLPVPPEDVAAFNALKLKLRQVTEVWGQEQSVYSPTLQLAGRFDLAGCYRQVPSIMDFKTAGRVKHRKDIEDYELQLAFYAAAHNEQFGTDIQQGVILMSSAGGMPQEFIVDIKAHLPELKRRVEAFWEKTLARF